MCVTLRRLSRGVRLLAAVDQQAGCVLSQMPIDEKTYEQKTALELLKHLAMKGHVVVGDAAFRKPHICQQFLDSEADDVISVMESQATLLRDIQRESSLTGLPFPTDTQQERAPERRPAQTVDN